ncbi:MAG: amino acid ABC transporter permease [Erysipelotrichaceae bacterium]|nr:amino acid ABC transporter permease [Erysipelotrichaceae bacterium]
MGPGIIEVFIEYWPMFLKGALGTLRYAAIAVAGGSILGALIAILRFKIFDGIATIYVDVLRGTPLLVQMYIAYFFLPLVFPALNKVDKEVTVLIALTLNSSAYVSEIIRGGINSVDIGQTEAARSLGLSAKNTMIKETSMAGTFMLYELMYTRTLLANKYLAWQPLFIIAGIYLVMTLVLTNLVKLFERRMSVSD